MRAGFILLITTLALAVLSFGAAFAGPPGFAFLEIPTGARASALGGAYASLAQGVDASYWNPAGLAGTKRLQLIAGHYELIEKLRHDHFAVAGRMWGGAASASIRALYSEPIDERDETGTLIGSFGSHDLELGVGYGRVVAPGLALGATADLLRERIANSAATTYGFGLGATWEPPSLAGVRLALVGQNLGPSARYTIDGTQEDPVPMPAALQAGISYGRGAAFDWNVRGAVEARLTRGRSGVAMLGAELASPVGAALRIGVRANDDASTMSFGAGYSVRSILLDYAFVPMSLDLGDTHRFSLTTQF